MADERDVIVAGAGPVGLVCALALARGGLRVVLAGPPARRDDRRTTALMLPALRFLAELGLPDFPADATAPLRQMRIVDGTSRLIRSAPVTFRAEEIGERAFGTNIPNSVLNAMLETAVEAEPGIDWRRQIVADWQLGADAVEATLDDGAVLRARLVVAADGRESPARAAAGITVTRRAYPQSALVLNFDHARPHGFVSTEFHTESGPFTQVPLPGDRSSLVWVVTPAMASELAALDDAELSRRIEAKMQSMLGRVTVEPGRQIWPLSALLPSTTAARRVALVGEAAHVFPPIGAQGMNLGLRDAADLARLVIPARADPGAPAVTEAYARARRGDVTARSTAVNLLNMSLLSDLLPAQIARKTGLGLLAGISPLRGFFMREGMQPGSGIARAFSSAREQVGRHRA